MALRLRHICSQLYLRSALTCSGRNISVGESESIITVSPLDGVRDRERPLPPSSEFGLRGFSSNPVQNVFKGVRESIQFPPNPFTYKAARMHGPKLVLYRGPGMLVFRFMVRMKIFQLAGVLTVATLFSLVLTADDPHPREVASALAVAVGCIATSYCVWYYSGRYVGELSLLLPEKNSLCFSVLDFWGSRQDDVVPLSQFEAPFKNRSISEVKAMIQPVLMPVKIKGGQEYYISMGHGHVLQEKVLLNILYGKLNPSEFASIEAEK
ncbi:hypothetical protein CEUSTIGMA_g12644.t1 [Chlamydomonas eustigma]|uniref:Transmembrane protein 186 n=1 Tax=Chlamydomonas eustigma TaxID=1157962 RepID=A0A250XQ86_9CHLO|nr:hypothetical protein CEUSTIGMA_g12644.t1 [Chlamydomonas eustigma]|eukprot:GAX85224.1 hypothetical protein CEUSTIGMA_g12644.t1 [Chlamydomonas eustigma]